MQIAILSDQKTDTRVAATPDTVKKFAAIGGRVNVQGGAGGSAGYADDEFASAGAALSSDPLSTVRDADIVLAVNRPSIDVMRACRPGAIVVATMDPHRAGAELGAIADAGVAAFAVELMPRITRAQSMDVLSSQASLAGYRAVLDGAAEFTRCIPMMVTAAGTVPAARVFVMGAGVAGLQAIATARRLGAIVTATDVRPAAKEQVESLGAEFIAVEDEEFRGAEASGGYAREMSKAYQAKQAELVASHIAKQDIVITTALIPGRPAPRLVSRSMVQSMRRGSVIVDLAVERGGNVEGAAAGVVETTPNGVRIVGNSSIVRLPSTASSLYARNLLSFVSTMIDRDAQRIAVDWNDVLVQATNLTRDGKVVHPDFASPRLH